MNLIDIGNDTWINSDNILAIKFVRTNKKPSVVLYVGDKTFVSNLSDDRLTKLLADLKSLSANIQFFSG